MALDPRLGHVEHALVELFAYWRELHDLNPLDVIHSPCFAEVDAAKIRHGEILERAFWANDYRDGSRGDHGWPLGRCYGNDQEGQQKLHELPATRIERGDTPGRRLCGDRATGAAPVWLRADCLRRLQPGSQD